MPADRSAYFRARYERMKAAGIKQTRDTARKRAYDAARYVANKVDLRPKTCVRDDCDRSLRQPRHGIRLFCSRSCLEKTFYALRYVPKPRVEPEPLPAPYTGHQWLEKARAAVGSVLMIEGTEITDRYYDEMGEALLALMEGNDPKEAIRAYRKREFVPRHLTKHIGDWEGDDSIDAWHRWESVMPQTQSAEDEFLATLV